jgi:hypothetical protein
MSIQRVLGTLTVLFVAGLALHGTEGTVQRAPRPELEARLKRAPSRRRRSPRSIWFVATPIWRRSRSAKRTNAGAIAIYERLIKARSDAVNAHLSVGRMSINYLKDYKRGEREVSFWLAI